MISFCYFLRNNFTQVLQQVDGKVKKINNVVLNRTDIAKPPG